MREREKKTLVENTNKILWTWRHVLRFNFHSIRKMFFSSSSFKKFGVSILTKQFDWDTNLVRIDLPRMRENKENLIIVINFERSHRKKLKFIIEIKLGVSVSQIK